MKKYLVITIFLFIGVQLNAQILTVKSMSSHQGLELVTVYSPDLKIATMTDQNGKADISAFSDADSINIRLMGHRQVNIGYKELSESDFIIYMEPTKISLEEIVISSSRWEQKRENIPNKITVIKPMDVSLLNPQTAADLLGISSEVYIQKSQMGGGSPMIRGFATNRVLLSVDGVRMNTAIFRSGNLQNVISLDPYAIERTEILFGPGSVIYGSDAIGGVMSFYTKKARLSTTDSVYVKGNVAGRFSSANMEKTGHLDFNVSNKKLAFLSSFTYTDYDDLKMGSSGPDDYLRSEYVSFIGKDTVVKNPDPEKQVYTGYSQLNMMQKIRFRPNDSLDINYGFHYSATSNYPRYDRLIRYKKDHLRSAEWYYGPQKWMMHSLDFLFQTSNVAFDMAHFLASYQFFEESRHDRDFGDIWTSNRYENVDALALNIDFEKHLKNIHTLFYGIEAVNNLVSSKAYASNIETNDKLDIGTRYPDGSTWKSYAAYLNLGMNIGEHFIIQPGIRYSRVLIDAAFDQTFYPFPFKEAHQNLGALTGKLGFIYKPDKSWLISLAGSNGFRAPNIDDMGKVFDSEPGSVVVPNPDLKPETAYNAELGIAKVFGEALKFDVSAYYTYLKDALVRRDFTLNGEEYINYDGELSRVQAIQNAAHAEVYGVQAGLDIRFVSGIGFSTHISYQKGVEELDDGTMSPMRHAAPVFGSSHITYQGSKFSADLYSVYNGAITSSDMPVSELGKDYMYALDANGLPYCPSWYTLNFKAMYHLLDMITLTAGIENITDVRYRPYSSGISAPGRNLIASIKINF
ncbi:MAG: TonB-dependent receptor [Marinilabiliales bacterium]|nr:MAG: TonB-dependent receptor [Marinilabiliales bacterium]